MENHDDDTLTRDDLLWMLQEEADNLDDDTEIAIKVINGRTILRTTFKELRDAVWGDNEDSVDDEEVEGMERLVAALESMNFRVDSEQLGDCEDEPNGPVIEISTADCTMVYESNRLFKALRELLLPSAQFVIVAKYVPNIGCAGITLTGVSDKHMK